MGGAPGILTVGNDPPGDPGEPSHAGPLPRHRDLPAPSSRPEWLSPEQFAALLEELTIRELRDRIRTPGFRTRTITLATTPIDAEVYPASASAELSYRRWQVEMNFRRMKITMKMDVLRCTTVDGVRMGLAVFAPAYNLIRSAMLRSARARGVPPERISLIDTLC